MKNSSFTAVAVALTAFATPMSFGQGTSSSQEQVGTGEPHGSSAVQSSQETKDMKDMKQIRATKLIGVSVTSKDGENLGQVQDLVIDPRSGKIRFALVGKGFMAGLGQQMIPVPWQAVQVRSEREFALNVDKQKLQSAPTWSQADLDQPDYVIRVYQFYELEPQTDVGTPGAGEEQSGIGQGNSSDSQHSTPPPEQSTQPSPK